MLPQPTTIRVPLIASVVAAAVAIPARAVHCAAGMFALLRKFVVGWLLIRLVRRLTGNRR